MVEFLRFYQSVGLVIDHSKSSQVIVLITIFSMWFRLWKVFKTFLIEHLLSCFLSKNWVHSSCEKAWEAISQRSSQLAGKLRPRYSNRSVLGWSLTAMVPVGSTENFKALTMDAPLQMVHFYSIRTHSILSSLAGTIDNNPFCNILLRVFIFTFRKIFYGWYLPILRPKYENTAFA